MVSRKLLPFRLSFPRSRTCAWPLDNDNLIPLVRHRIAEADVAAFEHRVRSLDVSAETVQCAGGAVGIVVVRRDEIGELLAVHAIGELRVFAGIANFHQVDHTLQRGEVWGAWGGGDPAMVRFPNGSASISSVS